MTRAWLIVAGVVAVGASLLVSLPLTSALVVLAVSGVAVWQIPRLRPYQWTLPIAVLIALSLVTQIHAIPGFVAALVLLVVAIAVIVRSPRRGGVRTSSRGMWGALGVISLPLVTLVVSSRVNPSATISWAMMGDGFEWIRYLGDLRALGPFELITTGLFPRLTMSTELLARTVLLPGTSTGVSGLLNDVQANVAWVVLGLSAAFADLLRNYGGRVRPSLAFVQGFVVSIVMCSTLVLGLVAANGFLSVSTTIALLVLSLIALERRTRTGERADLWVAIFGAATLITSWQPFALVVAGLLLGVGSKRWVGRWWPLVAGALVIVLVIASVFAVTGSISAAGAGHFPAMPLAALLVGLAALLVLAARGPGRSLAQLIAVAFVAGSIAAFLCFRGGDVWGLLASVHTAGVTPFYYVEKFIWIAAVPAIALLIVVLTSPRIWRAAGPRTAGLACVLVVGASVAAAQVPNLPWLPLGSRSDVLELGDLVLDPTATERTRAFVGFQAPHVDQVINAWSGLLWDRYLAEEPTGSGPGAARKEAIWSAIQGGDLVAAACAAARASDGPLTIITAQPTLGDETARSCADALGSVTFEVRVDRGV